MLHLKTLLDFISLHPFPAYGVIFLVSLAESLALVGLLVPGTMIMFGIGAIVATGSLGFEPVFLLAAAGAVAGDGISFWLGHHYHEELRRKWPFARYPDMLKIGEAFFHRHGGKSILFGRFVGPIRPVIPAVAGMLGMNPMHFGIVNVLSAIGWSFVVLFPGYFFGNSLAVAGAISSRLAVLITILLMAIWGFAWLSRKLALLVAHHGPLWLTTVKAWSIADTNTHGVGMMHSLKRLVAYFLLRRQGDEVFLGFLLVLLFSSGWGFLAVLQDVLAKDPLVVADQAAYHFFQTLRSPWTDQILVTLTELGDSFVNICISGVVLLVFLVKRSYRTAGYWVLTILGGLAGVQVLKWLIHVPRPVALYQGASAYGFPSGHTTMSVVIYGFLAILCARSLAGTLRWGLFVTVFGISFFIALSRLYLGAHWLSDVLGGFLIGTSWITLLGIAYIKGPQEIIPRRLLVFVTMLVIVTAGSWHVSQHHEKDLALYAPRKNIQAIPLATWLADGWRDLPTWRIDMEGENEQPLTIQQAGSPQELAGYLLSQGWQLPPPLNVKNVLGMLAPDTRLEDLPILPQLHDGRFDILRLVREANGYRWVLRIWPTDMEISVTHAPLSVGTIVVQNRRHRAGFLTLAKDTGGNGQSLAALQKSLQDRFAVKLVHRKATQAPGKLKQLQLNSSEGAGNLGSAGTVLLLSDKNA